MAFVNNKRFRETQHVWTQGVCSRIFCCRLTNLSDLKRHNFALLTSEQSPTWAGWPKIKMSVELCSCWRLKEGACFLDFASFQSAPVFLGSSPLPPSTECTPPTLAPICPCLSCLTISLRKTLPTARLQLRVLNLDLQRLFCPGGERIHRFWGLGGGYLWGPSFYHGPCVCLTQSVCMSS